MRMENTELGAASSEAPQIAPVSRAERISSIDLLRGFSLLGILLMNIISFGLPEQAYGNPAAGGGSTGWNLYIWATNYILFEGKMRAIFSMLFGAGIVIFTSRLEERGAGIRTADLYSRRMLWLLLFGMVHAYFFWVGDILYSYALTGLLLFAVRKAPPKYLLIAGVVILGLIMPSQILEVRELEHMKAKAAAADAAQKAGKTLTDQQKEDQKKWTERLKNMTPDPERIKKEIDAHRNGYRSGFAYRSGDVRGIESLGYYSFIFFDVCGMMLIGMALFKYGYFSAQASYGRYLTVALFGYAIGIAWNSVVVYRDIHSHFDPIVFSQAESVYQYERLLVALAHASLVMIIAKAGVLTWLTSRIAAVGQMALTNYFMDTLVCTTIFDRMKYFGQWQRYQVYFVVAALWTFQIVVSKIWLAYFRFGPVEWFWRSLTYWKRQPMSLREQAALSPVPPVEPGYAAGSPAA
jgi:uncharacterized protein